MYGCIHTEIMSNTMLHVGNRLEFRLSQQALYIFVQCPHAVLYRFSHRTSHTLSFPITKLSCTCALHVRIKNLENFCIICDMFLQGTYFHIEMANIHLLIFLAWSDCIHYRRGHLKQKTTELYFKISVGSLIKCSYIY
jgi:hypothetical protein